MMSSLKTVSNRMFCSLYHGSNVPFLKTFYYIGKNIQPVCLVNAEMCEIIPAIIRYSLETLHIILEIRPYYARGWGGLVKIKLSKTNNVQIGFGGR